MNRLQFIRLAFLFGTVAGVFCFAFFYLLKINHAMPLGTRRNIGILFMWVAMAVGAYRYLNVIRRPVNFIEIFGFCMLVVIVASVIDGLLVSSYIRFIEPSLIPEFIADLKRLALTDQARMKEQFGNQPNGELIDFADFLKQIEHISPASIFWGNFGIIRIFFHLLYSALVAIGIRKVSLAY